MAESRLPFVFYSLPDALMSKVEGQMSGSVEIVRAADFSALQKRLEAHPRQMLLLCTRQVYDGDDKLQELQRNGDLLLALAAEDSDADLRKQYLARGIWYYWDMSKGTDLLAAHVAAHLHLYAAAREARKAAIMRGRLSHMPLKEVIVSLIFSRETVDLHVASIYGHIIIHFENGQLRHARQGILRGNSAVLNAFLWPHGAYWVVKSRALKIPANVTASFAALIAEGMYRHEHFWKYWAERLSFYSAIDLRTDNMRQLSPRLRRLHGAMQRKQSLLYLLLSGESDAYALLHEFDRLIATGKLAYYVKQGKNSGNEQADATNTGLFTSVDMEQLESVFFAADSQRKDAQVIVSGSAEAGVVDFLQCLSGKAAIPISQVKEVFFTRLQLQMRSLACLGLPIDSNFEQRVRRLASRTLGFIFLIDARQRQPMEYTTYILNALAQSFPAGNFVVGLVHLEKARALPVQEIKQVLRLPRRAGITTVDFDDDKSIKNGIMQLAEIAAKNTDFRKF
jgi:signal recognition particle receptor subunit beta